MDKMDELDRSHSCCVRKKTVRICGSEDPAEKESNAATPHKLLVDKEIICCVVLDVAAKVATNRTYLATAATPCDHTAPKPAISNQTGAKAIQSTAAPGFRLQTQTPARRLNFQRTLQEAGFPDPPSP